MELYLEFGINSRIYVGNRDAFPYTGDRVSNVFILFRASVGSPRTHSIKSCARDSSHTEEIKFVMLSFCSELLWVAPELIPSTVVPGTPATQKGDVYSFAIILEEIVVRGGPFEAARQFLDPQGDEDLEL
jgi:hypothetical protein